MAAHAARPLLRLPRLCWAGLGHVATERGAAAFASSFQLLFHFILFLIAPAILRREWLEKEQGLFLVWFFSFSSWTSKGIGEYRSIPGTAGAFFIALQLSASLNHYNSLLISECVLQLVFFEPSGNVKCIKTPLHYGFNFSSRFMGYFIAVGLFFSCLCYFLAVWWVIF